MVTIGMPVRNGGRDLRLAIQSIAEQSFEDWELLLIDDGSTDGAVASIEAGQDSRIHVLSDGLNKGLAARLNQAIDLARGSYFARMDHDDVAHRERIARQVAFLEANPVVDLLGAKCLAMSEDERIMGELPIAITNAEICRRPWLGFYLAHPTWMGRTEWFRKHRYAVPAPFRCEDQELLLRAHTTSVYHALPEPLLGYRVRRAPSRATLFKTRSALLKVQLGYFGRRRKFGSAALSLAAFAARIARDPILPATAVSARPATNKLWSEWDHAIESVRRRADGAGLDR